MEKCKRHKILEDAPCNNCGFQEGSCERCDAEFSRDTLEENWTEDK